jgi:low affinity Fe/Cu permease
MKPPSRTSRFTRFAKTASYATGRPITFIIAVAVIIIWALMGRFFDYSDTWQLVINTSTTIITFLMVFLIQNTQNRDTETLQIKLDELIRAIDKAHNALLDLEELDDAQIHRIRSEYEDLAKKARNELSQAAIELKKAEKGKGDAGAVDKAEENVEQAESDLEIAELHKDEGG